MNPSQQVAHWVSFSICSKLVCILSEQAQTLRNIILPSLSQMSLLPGSIYLHHCTVLDPACENMFNMSRPPQSTSVKHQFQQFFKLSASFLST